jgi:phosphoribosylformylglycinamidine (FGAM) synthase-like amidotransferase family enzyme
VAHGEGCYYADAPLLAALKAEDRVVLRYLDNPNGSLDDIAGICNERRNVMGLMPHPERAADALLGSADGRVILESMVYSLSAAHA